MEDIFCGASGISSCMNDLFHGDRKITMATDFYRRPCYGLIKLDKTVAKVSVGEVRIGEKIKGTQECKVSPALPEII